MPDVTCSSHLKTLGRLGISVACLLVFGTRGFSEEGVQLEDKVLVVISNGTEAHEACAMDSRVAETYPARTILRGYQPLLSTKGWYYFDDGKNKGCLPRKKAYLASARFPEASPDGGASGTGDTSKTNVELLFEAASGRLYGGGDAFALLKSLAELKERQVIRINRDPAIDYGPLVSTAVVQQAAYERLADYYSSQSSFEAAADAYGHLSKDFPEATASYPGMAALSTIWRLRQAEMLGKIPARRSESVEMLLGLIRDYPQSTIEEDEAASTVDREAFRVLDVLAVSSGSKETVDLMSAALKTAANDRIRAQAYIRRALAKKQLSDLQGYASDLSAAASEFDSAWFGYKVHGHFAAAALNALLKYYQASGESPQQLIGSLGGYVEKEGIPDEFKMTALYLRGQLELDAGLQSGMADMDAAEQLCKKVDNEPLSLSLTAGETPSIFPCDRGVHIQDTQPSSDSGGD